MFRGFEPLGYRRVDVSRPERSWLTRVPWIPWERLPAHAEVIVYRKASAR